MRGRRNHAFALAFWTAPEDQPRAGQIAIHEGDARRERGSRLDVALWEI